MTKRVEVKGIQIRLPSGKVIELTMEQARDLYKELHGLFGSDTVNVHHWPIYVERPWTQPWPTVPYRWCGDTTAAPETPKRAEIWCMDTAPQSTGQLTIE